ncbi:MAG: protein tyrosine phosphatase family protein [Thermoanaerobaculia bacterium]
MRVRRSLAVCSVVTAVLLTLAGGACAQQAATSEPKMPEGWPDLVRNPRMPREGVLSGGQPTPEQLAAAKEAGFETVINIRVPGEPGTDSERELVESLGMTYVSLPVQGAAGMTEENAKALAVALDEAEQPVLLHCGSGNRIGGLFALIAYHYDDKTIEEAMAFGKEAGLTGLEPVVREKLESVARD